MTSSAHRPHPPTSRVLRSPSRGHRPPLRLHDRGEVAAAVPYLLGFRPWASVVFVGTAADRLVATARLDLADALEVAGEPPDAGPPDLVTHTLRALRHGGARAVCALIFEDTGPDSGVGFSWHPELFDLLLTAARRMRLDLLDVVQVSGGRWRSVTGGGVEAVSRPLPAEPSPFVAAATVDGVAPVPDRAALGRLLEPLPAAQTSAVASQLRVHRRSTSAAIDRDEMAAMLLARARSADQPEWVPPRPALAARLGLALTDIEVRDALWLGIDRHDVDGRPLWLHLGRVLPSPVSAPPLFLFAWASWRSGSGALAVLATDRALAADPDYGAARLLASALAHGVNPHALPSMEGSS